LRDYAQAVLSVAALRSSHPAASARMTDDISRDSPDGSRSNVHVCASLGFLQDRSDVKWLGRPFFKLAFRYLESVDFIGPTSAPS
jgi:hypothetical protein